MFLLVVVVNCLIMQYKIITKINTNVFIKKRTGRNPNTLHNASGGIIFIFRFYLLVQRPRSHPTSWLCQNVYDKNINHNIIVHDYAGQGTDGFFVKIILQERNISTQDTLI